MPGPPTSTPPSPPRHRLRLPIFLPLSLLLGLTTTLASILLLALFRDPPNTPPTTSRTFIRGGRAFSIVESHRFGITRAWWSQLTRAAMTAPTDKPALARFAERLGLAAPETEDPAQLIADLRAQSDPVFLNRRGGRILTAPAPWGQFASADPAAPLPAQQQLGCDVGYGWPFTAAWYQVRGRLRGNTALTDDLRHGHLIRGVPAARGDLTCRVIPLRPVWPGLLGNTATFTAAWLLAFLIPPLIRRALRKRRGSCPHCAYDLRATPPGSPCPECGRAPSRT
jgi:hypothetical protein